MKRSREVRHYHTEELIGWIVDDVDNLKIKGDFWQFKAKMGDMIVHKKFAIGGFASTEDDEKYWTIHMADLDDLTFFTQLPNFVINPL